MYLSFSWLRWATFSLLFQLEVEIAFQFVLFFGNLALFTTVCLRVLIFDPDDLMMMTECFIRSYHFLDFSDFCFLVVVNVVVVIVENIEKIRADNEFSSV